ncbi:L-arabinose isomerase [Escherichia coli]|uniref:L-arabinose isomerase n=1 Tax=Escherichia coli TaxID=562 RepID=A0A376VSA2_ECOLX|nr:L-arabinose isomerase [Escherichia coli]
MDFMNLNQTAHGGREFGFIGARMRQQHAVVTGHWQDKQAHERIGSWMRQAVSKQDTRHLKVCRFGDNMREVAVTDGDKVARTDQVRFLRQYLGGWRSGAGSELHQRWRC